MSQSYTHRKGWEGENLARFILSKFAFVAQPTTVADDVGSDFYCTLFEIKSTDKKDGNPYYFLVPKNSFAIQIKSDTENFRIDPEYLSELELPFFAGVANLRDLSLTVYSGEYVSALLSGPKPHPYTLDIELCDTIDSTEYYTQKNDEIILKFPKITEVKGSTSSYVNDLDELRKATAPIYECCRRMQKHIASRINHEYIFDLRYPSPYTLIFAGRTSVQHFEENFFKRLAEVFMNLWWMYWNANEELKNSIYFKFKFYETIYLQLTARREDLPGVLVSRYEQARCDIKKID